MAAYGKPGAARSERVPVHGSGILIQGLPLRTMGPVPAKESDRLPVDAFTRDTPLLKNAQYAALKTKDAVADALRSKWGHRPDVDRRDPDLGIKACTWSGERRPSAWIPRETAFIAGAMGRLEERLL